MTAPDRIWAYGFKNDMSENRQGEGWIHPLDAVQPNRDFTTEYIRKGAFDLVEIRARIVEMETVGEVDWAMTLNRILSLLEGSE